MRVGSRDAADLADDAADGATISIKKPSVLSDASLTADEMAVAQKGWNFKKRALSRAAHDGELHWSPGTEEVRIKELQSAYRENVAARFERRFGQRPDLLQLNADHPVDMIVGGMADQPFKMISERVNKSVGSSLRQAGKRAKLQRGDRISRIIFEE